MFPREDKDVADILTCAQASIQVHGGAALAFSLQTCVGFLSHHDVIRAGLWFRVAERIVHLQNNENTQLPNVGEHKAA